MQKWQDLHCSYSLQTVKTGLAIHPHSGECGYNLFDSSGLDLMKIIQRNIQNGFNEIKCQESDQIAAITSLFRLVIFSKLAVKHEEYLHPGGFHAITDSKITQIGYKGTI